MRTGKTDLLPKEKIPEEIWILVTAAFIIAVGFGIVAPVIPQFAISFGVGMAAAGAVVSVFAATRLLFAPVSGSLVDSIGSRTIYLSGLFGVAVTTGLAGFAQEYWHLVALRALGGFGSTMFTVSAMGLVVKLAPPSIRGRCSSAYASGFLFGNILGPIIGGALAVLGMRAPFFIYGTAVAIAACIVWWRLPKNTGMAPKGSTVLPTMKFREAFQSTAYRAALSSGFANGWTNFGVRVAVVPLFTATMFENGAAIAGIAMTAYAAGNAFSIQFSGRLADRYGRKPLIIAGLLCNGVFTATLGITHVLPALLAASALAGMGSGLFIPAQQASLADIVGAQQSGGKVLANFQMSQDFGAILGPMVIGYIAQTQGFGAAFGVCGALTLFTMLLWCFAEETLERPEQTTLPLTEQH